MWDRYGVFCEHPFPEESVNYCRFSGCESLHVLFTYYIIVPLSVYHENFPIKLNTG